MLSPPAYTYLHERKTEGFAHLVQPMYAKVREHGAPVQGERLGEEAKDLSPDQLTPVSHRFQVEALDFAYERAVAHNGA
jgi:hypothetical protein